MVIVRLLASIKKKNNSQDIDRPKNIKISKHAAILSSEYRKLRHTIPLTISFAITVSNLF